MRVDNLRQDIRYALRRLRHDAGFAVAAILIIGLAVGANTTIFSVVNSLLFRPLPFPGSSRLVWIENVGGDGGLSSRTTRIANYRDWTHLNHSFESLTSYFAFFDYGSYTMVGSGDPERLVGAGVEQSFLSFLGVQPQIGRNFVDDESKFNGKRAVILTNGLWKRRFGGDPNVIGRTLTLNDNVWTVVGVLPAWFDFSSTFTPGSPVDMLVPFPIADQTDRWGNTLAVIGRLKPNITVQQAQAEFDVLNEQIRTAHQDRFNFGARLMALQPYLTGRFRRGLFVLLAAVGAVLLVACANLSNLLLARAASRRREMAIRSAMGASRSRLIRQMLTESVILSFAGAALGLSLAWAGIRALAAFHRVSIPLLGTVRMDTATLLFTLAATLATGLLFGLVPALQTSSAKEAEALKDAGRGISESRHSAWTRGILVVSEIAFACVLLVGAGLLIRSFLHVMDVDLGFQPERAAAWRIDSGQKYSDGPKRAAFYDRLVHSIEAIPGVDSAGITDALPLSRDRSWGAGLPGVQYPKGQYPLAHPRVVDWRYLKTMRIPLVSGREFDERDKADSEKVIIINQKMARQLFPGRNPLGQKIAGNGDPTIVGVVGNVRHQALEEEGGMEFYFPITQMSQGSVELVVRSRVAMTSLLPSIRAALRSIEPNLPTVEYISLDSLVERAVSPRRFMVLLLSGFALAALLLASIGIYGVVSYTVSRRTAEIGIRMALGATTGQVQRHVMMQTMLLGVSGIVLGTIGALALARLTASLLYQLQPNDPVTFATTVSVLLIVAIAAGYLPALRASRLDPMSALRVD